MSLNEKIREEVRDSLAVVWREMLIGIFSTLGRMARLARCYDPQAEQYHHVQIVQELGGNEADHALRLAHGLVWSDWLRGSLQEQEADLRLYLSNGLQPLLTLQDKEPHPFLSFPPVSATIEERHFFTSNLEILLQLFSNQQGIEQPVAPQTLYQQLIQLIQKQHTRHNLSMQMLSTQLGRSERYLGRLLQETTGQSFRSYLRHLRITESVQLLSQSQHNIKNVAALVGYKHRSHFGEDFHRIMGCTPAEFRSKVRERNECYSLKQTQIPAH